MASSLPHPRRDGLLLRTETRPRMATAHLRKAETEPYRLKVGAAIDAARCARRWTLDELSGHLQRNARQVARWMAGTERPQLDTLFAVDDPEWRNALVIAFAKLGGGVEIDTVIRLRILKEEK